MPRGGKSPAVHDPGIYGILKNRDPPQTPNTKPLVLGAANNGLSLLEVPRFPPRSQQEEPDSDSWRRLATIDPSIQRSSEAARSYAPPVDPRSPTRAVLYHDVGAGGVLLQNSELQPCFHNVRPAAIAQRFDPAPALIQGSTTQPGKSIQHLKVHLSNVGGQEPPSKLEHSCRMENFVFRV